MKADIRIFFCTALVCFFSQSAHTQALDDPKVLEPIQDHIGISSKYPDQYWVVDKYIRGVGIKKIESEDDRWRRSFKIVKREVCCPDCISIESIMTPTFCITIDFTNHNSQTSKTVYLKDVLNYGVLYGYNMVFKRVKGLTGSGYSYQSYQDPNYYLCSRYSSQGNDIYANVKNSNDNKFNENATFIEVPVPTEFVNGRNLKMLLYETKDGNRALFQQNGEKNWERYIDNMSDRFSEINRDDRYVYLRFEPTNTEVQLDINTKKITFKGSENSLVLNIIEASPYSIRIWDGWVTFFNQAGYVARYTLTYIVNGETKSFNTGNLALGRKQRYDIPSNAINITVKGEGKTGLTEKSWRVTFEKSFASPPNICFKSYGTVFSPQWNNNCK